MMARFPGLSRVTSFQGLDLFGLDGEPLDLGHGPNSEPRQPWTEPFTGKHGRQRDFTFPNIGPFVNQWPKPDQPTTPDTETPGNVLGATSPDLVIMPGQAATGGGITVGAIALIALLGVGGWFIYKKVKGK